jgi:kinetochore protein Mis12/MTW1
MQVLPQQSNTNTASNGENKNNDKKPAPLTTHTTFTTSQLPHLRQLLASLKPHLPNSALPSNTTPLPHATNSQPQAKDKEELSRQRKVYIESQSKRILERRGVDTRDGVEGVWEGGSRVGADEVRGLEGLVDAFGRGDKAKKANEQENGDDGDVMDTS